ncbi:MAG TPA: MotA/TolQ/ExbB proton channel family protein [Gemmatimonadota bacterium]|jgi:biopolymer transport protein TolQ|nr:MotA/TolQ/ExbB proton channel family protein [Gemmatimonadota bacterium]
MIALLLQGDPGGLIADPSIWNMVRYGSTFGKIILLILVGFSLISWAIIIQKMVIFRRLKGKRKRFFEVFERRSSLAEAYQGALGIAENPLTEVFKAGIRELKHLSQRPVAEERDDLLELATTPASVAPPLRATAITILEKESIHMALDREAAQQVESLEKGLSFLATTGNVAPFLGLLGTVWGVMDAFLNIGLRGTGNLTFVAPGIAEALITTVAGLAVAIPAVIAYNASLSGIKEISDELGHFSSELINLIIRERRA